MSSLKQIDLRDLVGGLVVAVGTGVFTLIAQMAQNQQSIDLKAIGYIAIAAGAAYLAKKFSQDEDNKYLGKY